MELNLETLKKQYDHFFRIRLVKCSNQITAMHVSKNANTTQGSHFNRSVQWLAEPFPSHQEGLVHHRFRLIVRCLVLWKRT